MAADLKSAGWRYRLVRPGRKPWAWQHTDDPEAARMAATTRPRRHPDAHYEVEALFSAPYGVEGKTK